MKLPTGEPAARLPGRHGSSGSAARAEGWAPLNGALLVPLACAMLLVLWDLLATRAQAPRDVLGVPRPAAGEPPPEPALTAADGSDSGRAAPGTPVMDAADGHHAARIGAPTAGRSVGSGAAPMTAETAPEAWLELTLLHDRAGTVVPGARVELAQGALRRVLRADDTGRLRTRLAPGAVRLAAWSGRSAGGPDVLTLEAGVTVEHALRLDPAFVVAGRVLEAGTGRPIEGARVSIWTFAEADTVTTARDGSFRHERFPAGGGAQQVHVAAEGFGGTVRYLTIDDGGAWELSGRRPDEADRRGTGTPFVELELVPELRITGRLVDGGGRPLPGASASAEGYYRVRADVASRDHAQSATDEAGRFTLAGLRSDVSHGVVLRAPGSARTVLEIAEDRWGTLDLGAIVLQPEQVVHGVVLDASGQPAEDVELILWSPTTAPRPAPDEAADGLDVAVRIDGTEHDQRTTPAGTFLFDGLAPGTYHLELVREDVTLLERELAVGEPLQATGLELRLPANLLTLEGRVDAEGLPPEEVLLTVERRGRVARVRVGTDGSFRVAGLDVEAPYRLSARHPATGARAALEAWAFERPVLGMRPSGGAQGPVLARRDAK